MTEVNECTHKKDSDNRMKTKKCARNQQLKKRGEGIQLPTDLLTLAASYLQCNCYWPQSPAAHHLCSRSL